MHQFAQSFRPEKAAEPEITEAKALIHKIRATLGFAIDGGGKIQHQWLNTCGSRPGTNFYEWFYQALKDGKVRLVAAALAEGEKKRLRIDHGFPDDQFEYTYIAVANVTKTRYIVSNDMHFYEPACKDANDKAKARARTERKGCACRYLKHKLRITVGTVQHAAVELWAEGGPVVALGPETQDQGCVN